LPISGLRCPCLRIALILPSPRIALILPVCGAGAPVPVLRLGAAVCAGGIALARLHSALVLCVLPRGLPGRRILTLAPLRALAPRAAIGRLVPPLSAGASVGTLLAALVLRAALCSAAGAAGALLGLLCRGDARCREQRKRGKAGQQCMVSTAHQVLSVLVGCLRMQTR
jgi:hypothetical protein